MPQDQRPKSLDWWVEDPTRLQNAEFPHFWESLVDTPGLTPQERAQELQAMADWGKARLQPIAGISDPRQRASMLFDQLNQAKDQGDLDAQDFLKAYPASAMDTNPLGRFFKGATRGVIEGFATPYVADKLEEVSKGYIGGRPLGGGGPDDPAMYGNIAGNIGGFVAGPGKFFKIPGVSQAVNYGVHGLGQALGGRAVAEDDKLAQREMAKAQGEEVPSYLKPSPWHDLPGAANIIAQTGLSAASGGLSGKVQGLMKAGAEIPKNLARLDKVSPFAEQAVSGAAQLYDNTAGNIGDFVKEQPGAALTQAGTMAAMGAFGSGVNAMQHRGYQATPPPPVKPIPAHGNPTTQPKGANTYPAVTPGDMDVPRSVFQQGVPDMATRHTGILNELLKKPSENVTGVQAFLQKSTDPNFERKLMSVLDVEDMKEADLPVSDYARYWGQEPGTEDPKLEGYHSSNLRDPKENFNFGLEFPGAPDRMVLSAQQFDLTINSNRLANFTDPATGKNAAGVVIARPLGVEPAGTSGSASTQRPPGTSFFVIAVPNPDGTYSPKMVDAENVIEGPPQPKPMSKVHELPPQRKVQKVSLSHEAQDLGAQIAALKLQLRRPKPVASHPTPQVFPEDDFALPGMGGAEWKLKGPEWTLPRKR